MRSKCEFAALEMSSMMRGPQVLRGEVTHHSFSITGQAAHVSDPPQLSRKESFTTEAK
jgi:hypothetical protein